jgi:cobalt/nickel transport system permease protein
MAGGKETRARMSSFTLDRYIPRSSPVHAAEPRLKLILVVGFILSISLLPIGSFVALGIAFCALTVLSIVARLGPFRLVKGAFVALPFLLAAFPLIFTKTGDPIGDIDLGLFTLTVSGEGLRQFATIAFKSWVSVQAALLLTFTTPFPEIVEALRRLRVPKLMVAIISFMYRYLAVLTDEATRMLRARSARAASIDGQPKGSLTWRAKVVGSMVGSLFLRAYERSERIYAAMQSRGFTGELRFLDTRAFVRGDWVVLTFAAGLLAAFQLSAHAWMPHS